MALDRFDQIVFSIIALLVLAISAVILAGNRIGVQIESYSPEVIGRTDSSIRVRFFVDMNQSSVEERFEILPAIEGDIRWNGARELIFDPAQALIGGEKYTVQVQKGAKSADGSANLQDTFRFDFQIRLPRVAYLSPASAQERNLYLQDLNLGETTQLTNTKWGILDYAVSPNGDLIAYTLYNEDGTSDIWVYGLSNGSSAQLTQCVNATCGAPDWKPDGTIIAYEREEYDLVLGQVGARRIWTVALSTAQSSLLFEDTQITGHSPTYSSDGNKIALFSTNPPGILIYDFITDSQVFIESLQGVVGVFSPDARYLVYPILVRGAIGAQFYTHLEMVDLQANQRTALTQGAEDSFEDSNGAWRPNYPNQMAVSRRYFDNRFTDGSQIYLLHTDTLEAEPLVVDGDYTHGSLMWSPDGNLLLMQRFNRVEQGARPQIWLYSPLTDELSLIADDAFLPSFVP